MRIIVKNLQKKVKINPTKTKRIAEKIAVPSRSSKLKLTLYFIKNSVIRQLNKEFFGRNRLTDVISFRLSEDYAEVFIAPLVVRSNAVEFKVGFKEELYRCAVHGFLHVFGYKDDNKANRRKMWKRQELVLRKLQYFFES